LSRSWYVLSVCAMSAAVLLAGACSKNGKPEAAAGEPAAAPGDPATVEDQKTIYAMGRLAAEQLDAFAFNEDEKAKFLQGIQDQLDHKGEPVKAEDYAQRINALTQSRLAILAGNERKKGDAFLAKAAGEPGAQKLPSGAIYQEVEAGTGPSPRPMDGVRVQLKLSDVDGNVLENSLDRGQPVNLIVGSVIPCLSEGLQRMKKGGKAKFVCPGDSAFGNQSSSPRIKPGQALVFETELLEIVPDAAKQVGQGGGPQGQAPTK
jgi:FKBP-type peptidyl-prolyl cis-trans isomerase FkpA